MVFGNSIPVVIVTLGYCIAYCIGLTPDTTDKVISVKQLAGTLLCTCKLSHTKYCRPSLIPDSQKVISVMIGLLSVAECSRPTLAFCM